MFVGIGLLYPRRALSQVVFPIPTFMFLLPREMNEQDKHKNSAI